MSATPDSGLTLHFDPKAIGKVLGVIALALATNVGTWWRGRDKVEETAGACAEAVVAYQMEVARLDSELERMRYVATRAFDQVHDLGGTIRISDMFDDWERLKARRSVDPLYPPPPAQRMLDRHQQLEGE